MSFYVILCYCAIYYENKSYRKIFSNKVPEIDPF